MTIPDDLAQRLSTMGKALSHRALEALAFEEYCAARLTKAEMERLLGLSSTELEKFVAARSRGAEGDVDLAEAIRRRFAPEGGVDLAPHPPVEPSAPLFRR